MNVEDEKRLLRSAEIRAVRALRLALTVLRDASADIVANFAGDPGDEPEEIERARVKAWNTMGPLLTSAAKGIETFAKSGSLGADYTAKTIDACENVLRTLEEEGAAERRPNIQKLRIRTEGPAADESER
jgi:hypothetical protein